MLHVVAAATAHTAHQAIQVAPALLASLKVLVPFGGMDVPFASDWTSHDGMVRGHYDGARNLVYIEADFGHDRDDWRWALELLQSRGWEPTENPMDDELLDDGVRVYFDKVEVA